MQICKAKARENVGSTHKEMEDLIIWNLQKAEVLGEFFELSFLASALATLHKTAVGSKRFK